MIQSQCHPEELGGMETVLFLLFFLPMMVFQKPNAVHDFHPRREAGKERKGPASWAIHVQVLHLCELHFSVFLGTWVSKSIICPLLGYMKYAFTSKLQPHMNIIINVIKNNVIHIP